MRLRQYGAATEEELGILAGLLTEPRAVEAGTDLLAEGWCVGQLCVLLSGWAYRYKLLANGNRQIITVLLPGDVCNLGEVYLSHVDYAVRMLTACTVASIDFATFRLAAARHPGLAQSFGWLGAAEDIVLSERVVSLGRRTARARLAHLLCELFLRLEAIGHTSDVGYSLPLTQADMSDVLGMSVVHINRSLQALRDDGLIRLKGRELVILDWSMLQVTADFQPDYLEAATAAVPASPG